MTTLASFNLMQWVDDNRHLLKPPVLNQTIFAEDDFIVQIVGGPNIRTDYHDDPYEEFFFQLKGDMILKVFEDQIAKWQVPDRVVFTEALPRNATGKVLKRDLRDRFGDVLMQGQS